MTKEDKIEIPVLPEITEESEYLPIHKPILKIKGFEKQMNNQILDLDERREECNKRIKEDILKQNYLKRMDFVVDALDYIKNTDFIDELSFQIRQSYIEVIKEMISICNRDYVTLTAYNDLKERLESTENALRNMSRKLGEEPPKVTTKPPIPYQSQDKLDLKNQSYDEIVRLFKEKLEALPLELRTPKGTTPPFITFVRAVKNHNVLSIDERKKLDSELRKVRHHCLNEFMKIEELKDTNKSSTEKD